MEKVQSRVSAEASISSLQRVSSCCVLTRSKGENHLSQDSLLGKKFCSCMYACSIADIFPEDLTSYDA